MNRRDFMKASSVVGAGTIFLPLQSLAQVAAPKLPPSGADGWVSLLNGRDLNGWYSMLQKSGKGVAEKRNMVLMEESMLHIMGNEENEEPAEPGYLATNQEFENVHIRLEYKWGMKRFAPRTYSKRDNGLLYGLVGEDKVWPTCIECQIEEGDVGDYFMVGTRGVQDEHFNGIFGRLSVPRDGQGHRQTENSRLSLPRPGNSTHRTSAKLRMGILKCSMAGIPLKSFGREIDRPTSSMVGP